VRIYRIPFSTNVERVALAAGYKGVPVDWVDVDPLDRRRRHRTVPPHPGTVQTLDGGHPELAARIRRVDERPRA
jgi:Glutathione S-transferase, N-terminal domain